MRSNGQLISSPLNRCSKGGGGGGGGGAPAAKNPGNPAGKKGNQVLTPDEKKAKRSAAAQKGAATRKAKKADAAAGRTVTYPKPGEAPYRDITFAKEENPNFVPRKAGEPYRNSP